jgi:type IV pilus assembly protein PilX
MIERRRARQAGMVLITTLLLLIVVTILAVGMFRSYGLDERIAGNLREKHRAVNAAETAEQYAEWWLGGGNGTTGVSCTAPIPLAAMTVCSNPLTNPAQLPWASYTAYQPSIPSVPMVLSGTGGQDTYSSYPAFYITYLGPWPVGNVQGSVYQIDAVGYAGSPDTAAVVESTYLVKTQSSCVTCAPGSGG